MRIKHITEKDGEEVVFQGTLEGPELAFVVEVGLNKLLLDGALPFVSTKTINKASIVSGNDSTN